MRKQKNKKVTLKKYLAAYEQKNIKKIQKYQKNPPFFCI